MHSMQFSILPSAGDGLYRPYRLAPLIRFNWFRWAPIVALCMLFCAALGSNGWAQTSATKKLTTATPPNTMALCSNPYYCIYDVPTNGSALAAEQAFVKAVGSNALGEDNFSEYPAGYAPYLWDNDLPNGIVCDASGYCGGSTQSNPGIPNGAGNYLAEATGLGDGTYYIGFDYAYFNNQAPSIQFDFGVSGGPLWGPNPEPSKGFFGVIASSTLGGINTPNYISVDNVLWAGAAGQITYPDSGACTKGNAPPACYLLFSF